MAVNMAVKRAKKAQNRKQVAAQRRKLEVVESALGGRARRASLAPIQHCYLHGDVGEGGMATVILARGVSPYQFTVAYFLVDALCLGIKDVFVRDLTSEELATFVGAMVEADSQIAEVDPTYARKLVRSAAGWAATIGFKPPRDFLDIEQIFGEVDAAACDTAFDFGRNGRPFYIPGPSETPAQIRQRLQRLRSRLGDDGFEFALGLEDDEPDDTLIEQT